MANEEHLKLLKHGVEQGTIGVSSTGGYSLACVAPS